MVAGNSNGGFLHEVDAGHRTRVFTALAKPGYRFDRWTSHPPGAQIFDKVIYDMSSNGSSTATAQFIEAGPTELDVQPDGAGEKGYIAVSPARKYYDIGEEVLLTAKPIAGYEFDKWDGDVEDKNDKTTTVYVPSGTATVRAYFKDADDFQHPGFRSGTPTCGEGVGTGTILRYTDSCKNKFYEQCDRDYHFFFNERALSSCILVGGWNYVQLYERKGRLSIMEHWNYEPECVGASTRRFIYKRFDLIGGGPPKVFEYLVPCDCGDLFITNAEDAGDCQIE